MPTSPCRPVEGHHHDLKGAFTFNITVELQPEQVEMLQWASPMTDGPGLTGEDWLYQQDNAATNFLERNTFGLPVCSSDLNPTDDG